MIHQPQRQRPVVYSHTAHANITRCSIKRCLFSVCIAISFFQLHFSHVLCLCGAGSVSAGWQSGFRATNANLFWFSVKRMRTRTHRIIRFYFRNDLSAANGEVRRIRCAICAHPAHPSITIYICEWRNSRLHCVRPLCWKSWPLLGGGEHEKLSFPLIVGWI